MDATFLLFSVGLITFLLGIIVGILLLGQVIRGGK